ncbi:MULTISPECIES: mercury resistance system periplasmic binding protein MerP [Shewanella]|jgi:mercuric ion binding protein|uniref:Periplasmic mercury ion-binding protein n=3 Tax=Pseudomonadota TaxID=1224 RepID=A0A5B8R283_9GAMM|nr:MULTISPECIES: mercury resistance system periplasmic binding protein MerP [Shewanella]CAC14714.1 merP protein [Pseudomonas sp. BW13]MBW0298828.1 mercuric transport protein periplasmic component [Shewanella xiamenensis]MCB2384718.1 mercury resistance system periplasmic binding protein MerP [Shewanella sp. SR1]MCD8552116.1 mercury resistance system periplasmic binding protein MerP [Shewanella xiamenensis]MCL1136884.1 mercury resistance system periplasmic binding protein MerP [Shewanella hafnie
MKKLTFVLMLFVTSLTAWAKPQTVTLDLPTMNCAMCPITVKKALTKVDGVSRAEVSYEDKEAMVTFDDEKTSADALIEATTNAGYPSTIKNKAN